jgi:hypothetical protein
MRSVIVLYESSCPSVNEARTNLRRALSLANLPEAWREVDVNAPDTPADWRTLGSPTILIDGDDVGGAARAAGATCRLYEEEGRLLRAPSVERIVARLRAIP